jgi:hypothetical protein
MESALKVLEFAAKYSWAVAVVCAFLLFVPEKAAGQIGILKLRQDYGGYLWIGLVFCAALWIAALARYIEDQILGGWLQTRRAARKAKEDAAAQDAKEARRVEAFNRVLALRLDALAPMERLWLQYCVFHNRQTLTAVGTDPTAQSLAHKELLEQGAGHIMDLPFHIPDEVWRYLCDHRRDLITEEQEGSRGFREELIAFKKMLDERN